MNLVNNDLQVNHSGTAHTNTQAPNEQQAAEFSDALASARQTIKVQKGDTVSELAEKYHTTTDKVVQANQLENPDFILAGQNLTIPGRVKSSESSSNAASVPVSSNSGSTVSELGSTQVGSTQVGNKNSNLEPPLEGAEKEARDFIIQHESSNNYNARNGRYIGKYQLDQNYLNGDFSPANQEKVAAEYVKKRYGNWVNAQQHWAKNNWY